MIIKGQLELIGSGSYQRIRQDIEAITGYDILHNWESDTLNKNEDGVHTLNNRLNRDRVIFEKVTGYDYLDSKNNDVVSPESIDTKVQQIDKSNINGDNINSRLNRDREIFKAVTGYVYDDEEDGVNVTLGEIAKHVEDTNKTVITGDSINARINRDREILKAITGYENYEDEIDDKTSLVKKISDDVQKDGGSVKEVVRGITGYIYDKDPSKDDAEADIKTVVENITGYTFHKDSSVKTNGGNISEVVSAITGYEFNTDLTDDNNCSIKGKVEDITGYDYDTSASAQGGTVREVVKAITGYEFNKALTETNNDDKNLSIHTRIVNEIADRIADVDAEEKRAKDEEERIEEKLDQEIDDRKEADTLIHETVASITGYPFEKITGNTLSIKSELAKRVPYSLHKNVNVVENIKDVVKLDVPDSSNEAMYCPQGLIMGGSAQSAGLVTRGICGVSTPDGTGSCTKENLYINYDGTNTYSPGRQLVIQAGEIGAHYGHNLYQFTAARGDSVKGYVDSEISVLTDTITELRKNIVVLELDKGYKITSPTIKASYEEGTLNDVILEDINFTSENLQIGSNEVNVKITNISIGDKSYPLTVDSSCEIILGELGDIQLESPIVIPVEITDTVTKTVTNPDTGLEEEVEKRIYSSNRYEVQAK